ncbi:sugar phosphate isomerase/epimerase family protein [Marinoscillum furvescens]|uniref:Sugar phosphate isomerase/epimerase n=1 Tax=Marinoscillum furvescens DSM 4134 TaxID=1122208 RepID=A0A3D9L6T7_MARFU|nr:sugar phosphate isomerase/epimerase [Marinoscillum furvescens]REE02025.1 sugar phosphate isomerase/epimerase [Marinoscillum furvescens DSM 4134]
MNFYATVWGFHDRKPESFLRLVKESGYKGIETSVPTWSKLNIELRQLLDYYELQLVAQVAIPWNAPSMHFDEYKSLYQRKLAELEELMPIFVNAQTGKDYFTFDQNCELLEMAAEWSERSGITLVHETHRGKFSFAPFATQPYLEKYPELRLAGDFSHWACVCESWLHDQSEALKLAFSRTDHLHLRVGHRHGPQVVDPFLPENEEALRVHMEWWSQVLHLKGQNLTLTPEFGPAPYMAQVPFTGQPLADQWELNLKMKEAVSMLPLSDLKRTNSEKTLQ